MRRQIFSTLLILAAFALPAQAQGVDMSKGAPSQVIARIESEGFTITSVHRTLLGRTLIVSRSRNSLREVVLNRFTGEILRDRQFSLGNTEDTPPTPRASDGKSTGSAESGAGSGGNGGAGSGKN